MSKSYTFTAALALAALRKADLLAVDKADADIADAGAGGQAGRTGGDPEPTNPFGLVQFTVEADDAGRVQVIVKAPGGSVYQRITNADDLGAAILAVLESEEVAARFRGGDIKADDLGAASLAALESEEVAARFRSGDTNADDLGAAILAALESEEAD